MKFFKHLLLAVLFLLIAGCVSESQNFGSFGSSHDHADFLVIINGETLNFRGSEFQTHIPDEGLCGDTTKLAHLHGGIGTVAHKHASKVTWQYLFSTLKINLTNQCISFQGQTYCNNEEQKLNFQLNGEKVDGLGEINDLDKVLVIYGSETPEQIQEYYEKITDLAKIQGKGESCSGEGFNTTRFSEEYFKAINASFYRNLTSQDVEAVLNASAGASKEAFEEIEDALWLAQKSLGEHAVHSLRNSYLIQIKNESVYCLPHEASHVKVFIQFKDEEKLQHTKKKLEELLEPYSKFVNKNSNNSKTFAEVNLTIVNQTTGELIQRLIQEDYSNETIDLIEHLEKQPC